AQRRGELAKASEIQYGRIPELEKKLADATAKSAKAKKSLLREEVTEEDIAEVVSSWTHIPVSRLQEGEREKLVKLEAHLHWRAARIRRLRRRRTTFRSGATQAVLGRAL